MEWDKYWYILLKNIMQILYIEMITNESEVTDTQIVVKQFEELRPNSVIEVKDIMTFDLSRLKGYVGKLAQEQIEELDKALETVREK